MIVDAGVLYALSDRRDAYHQACADWLTTAEGPLVIVAPALAEACHLIGKRCGAEVEARFLESCGTDRTFHIAQVTDDDFPRMAELVRQYSDLPLGGSDAAVIAVAERLGVSAVATVDRKHFTIIRPNHVPAFTLVP